MKTCHVCPHLCELNEGEIGKCLVRKNIDDRIQPTHEGMFSIISVDAIEKRPFFHFYPGSKFLSVGGVGCQFSCAFCLNFKISQSTSAKTTYYSPENLVELAEEKKVKGIAFSFNEPTIHYEYIMDLHNAIRRSGSGLKIALKSNGFMTNYVLEDLDIAVDAWNIDIKGGMEEYKNVCEAEISPVLASIELLSSRDTHLEISYLVLPQTYDSIEHHLTMRDWLTDLSPDIPVHLLCFYPIHRMSHIERANTDKMKNILNLFREKLNYVYISNSFQKDLIDYRHTKCSSCDKTLIERLGTTSVNNLSCCDKSLAGIFDTERV